MKCIKKNIVTEVDLMFQDLLGLLFMMKKVSPVIEKLYLFFILVLDLQTSYNLQC